MNKTEEMVLMCLMATELQKGWRPNIGDLVSTNGEVQARSYYLIRAGFKGRKWNYSTVCICHIGYVTDTNGYGCGKIDVDEKMVEISQGPISGSGFEVLIKDVIWIPKINQLQAMIERTTWHLEQSFHEYFLNDAHVKVNNDLRTSNQLWLAFIMKEKYNKSWNGEEWEKINGKENKTTE